MAFVKVGNENNDKLFGCDFTIRKQLENIVWRFLQSVTEQQILTVSLF